MKYLKLISTILITFMLLATYSAFSQEFDPEEDIFIRQLNENQFGAPVPGGFHKNQAILMQTGSFNTGHINQQNTANFQQENVGIIIQVGNSNQSNLTQIGAGNYSSINQMGNNNSTDLMIEGNFNSTSTLQMGDNNIIDRKIAGDYQSFDLMQLGNDNTFSLGASVLPGMKITQQGNGMMIEIR